MKTILALLALAVAADLGTISDKTGIRLIRATNRQDFLQWRVELEPGGIRFTTTNDILTMKDFAALPSGRTVLGLRQVCLDGAESRISVYTFDLVRDEIAAPGAERIFLLTTNNPPALSLREVMEKKRSEPMNWPPLIKAGTNAFAEITRGWKHDSLALPGGTNDSYGEWRERVRRSQNEGRRRAE